MAKEEGQRMTGWDRAGLIRKSIWDRNTYTQAGHKLWLDNIVSAKPIALAALPSFFIIGPPRTGSTWLHDVLRRRVLLPGPTKETRFFDAHFHRGLDWYRSHFPRSRAGQKIGEVAPTYFASPEARERIAQTVPNAKVVCTFRNPVERVLSLYRLKRAYGMIPWSFEEALVSDPELVESSKYASNLLAWQRVLGPEQVMATIYDDLRTRPQTYLDSLMDFIEVPRFLLSPSQTRYIHSSETMTHPRNYYRTRSATIMADWLKARRMDSFVATVKKSRLMKLFLGGGPPFPELSRDESNRLYEHFRPEVEELETIMGRDLSAWKNPRVQRAAS
jgi:hypothetical protein